MIELYYKYAWILTLLFNLNWKISNSCLLINYTYNNTIQFKRLSNSEATFVQITRMQRLTKTLKPCHVGIHWIALTEYSQMHTHMPGFQ